MPRHAASDLAHRLGEYAEAVCRHYLANGRRQGNYWTFGDVRNAPGRSMMFVRLQPSPKGPPGKWTEYVAPRVVLRRRDWALSCRRSTAFTQHNVSAREVS